MKLNRELKIEKEIPSYKYQQEVQQLSRLIKEMKTNDFLYNIQYSNYFEVLNRLYFKLKNDDYSIQSRGQIYLIVSTVMPVLLMIITKFQSTLIEISDSEQVSSYKTSESKKKIDDTLIGLQNIGVVLGSIYIILKVISIANDSKKSEIISRSLKTRLNANSDEIDQFLNMLISLETRSLVQNFIFIVTITQICTLMIRSMLFYLPQEMVTALPLEPILEGDFQNLDYFLDNLDTSYGIYINHNAQLDLNEKTFLLTGMDEGYEYRIPQEEELRPLNISNEIPADLSSLSETFHVARASTNPQFLKFAPSTGFLQNIQIQVVGTNGHLSILPSTDYQIYIDVLTNNYYVSVTNTSVEGQPVYIRSFYLEGDTLRVKVPEVELDNLTAEQEEQLLEEIDATLGQSGEEDLAFEDTMRMLTQDHSEYSLESIGQMNSNPYSLLEYVSSMLGQNEDLRLYCDTATRLAIQYAEAYANNRGINININRLTGSYVSRASTDLVLGRDMHSLNIIGNDGVSDLESEYIVDFTPEVKYDSAIDPITQSFLQASENVVRLEENPLLSKYLESLKTTDIYSSASIDKKTMLEIVFVVMFIGIMNLLLRKYPPKKLRIGEEYKKLQKVLSRSRYRISEGLLLGKISEFESKLSVVKEILIQGIDKRFDPNQLNSVIDVYLVLLDKFSSEHWGNEKRFTETHTLNLNRAKRISVVKTKLSNVQNTEAVWAYLFALSPYIQNRKSLAALKKEWRAIVNYLYKSGKINPEVKVNCDVFFNNFFEIASMGKFLGERYSSKFDLYSDLWL